jgi:hypothetical protein
MTLILLLLILVPIAAGRWARRQRNDQRWRITGAAFGAIVGPLCIGLYAIYSIFPLGGMLGLTAGLIHNAPGYEIATFVGLVDGKQVQGIDHLWIAGVNAIVWGAVYGALGWLVDRHRMRRNVHAATRARAGSEPAIEEDAR